MKRRLPTINQGESVLTAINLPPLTAETNRQHPNAAQPGRPTAACHAAVIAANAQSATDRIGAIATPPSSTASAANATATRVDPTLKRRHHPRAVV
jgi:hypothetical protein